MFIQNTLQSIYAVLTDGLAIIYQQDESASIAKILLDHLGFSNLDLISKKTQTLTGEQIEFLEQALKRLQKNEPIQYILGKADFYGLEFTVNPSVLIPRQETEELVDLILKENDKKNPKILDIGTGSGCIALSLKKNIPEAAIDALDNSEEAIQVAIENARSLDINVHYHCIDILHEAILPGDYDIIVSNPPYVTVSEQSEMMGNVIYYEPHNALFIPDESPLVFCECIVELASRHLLPDAKLYFEINENLGQEVKTLLMATGFQQIRIMKDLNRKERIAACSWPAKT